MGVNLCRCGPEENENENGHKHRTHIQYSEQESTQTQSPRTRRQSSLNKVFEGFLLPYRDLDRDREHGSNAVLDNASMTTEKSMHIEKKMSSDRVKNLKKMSVTVKSKLMFRDPAKIIRRGKKQNTDLSIPFESKQEQEVAVLAFCK